MKAQDFIIVGFVAFSFGLLSHINIVSYISLGVMGIAFLIGIQ